MTKKESRTNRVYYRIILLIAGVMGGGETANILYAASFPALSHYQMLEPLMLNLARRGHNITVLSHFPQKEKIGNYTDVDLRGLFPTYEIEFKAWRLFDDAFELFSYGNNNCRTFASSDKIQRFIMAGNKFDLIFIDAFDTDCLLGLVAKFKAPFILFCPMGLPMWESDWIYNPTEPAYFPDNICRLAGKMSFYERLQNVGCQLLFRGLNWFLNVRPFVELARKYFHLDVGDFDSLKRNVSFIFVNSFHGVTGVRPLHPNVLEIGGIHLKPPKPLPERIENFFQDSNGVVVISMGSIVKSHTLSPAIKTEFLSAISKLSERVLWKWEEDFPDKPKNLMTIPWLPQADVLRHPKVKLFISHGGIHGLYEAIYNGVPIIGIPLFGDQIGNLKSLELKDVAIVIDFAHLSEKTLSSAINRILSNDRKNAEKLSRIFQDQPQTPLEKALFWTEYVLRHGGTPHFQNGATQLSWLQYALVDVDMEAVVTASVENKSDQYWIFLSVKDSSSAGPFNLEFVQDWSIIVTQIRPLLFALVPDLFIMRLFLVELLQDSCIGAQASMEGMKETIRVKIARIVEKSKCKPPETFSV